MATAGTAAVGVLAGCGGESKPAAARASPASSPAAPPLSRVIVLPRQRLHGGEQTVLADVFKPPWDVSFDVRLARATRLDATLGHLSFSMTGRAFGAGGWHHVELTASQLRIDGHKYRFARVDRPSLQFGVSGGHAEVRALIISSSVDRAALLLHRIAELYARLPAGAFPIGADQSDRLHNSSSYWTSGFWPGALWQAAALEPTGGMFQRWALSATIAHFGRERADTHDVGFMYGESSLAAWQALCHGGAARSSRCRRLKRSVLSAANELVALALSNRRARTIPTNSRGPEADTIIDSVMNAAALMPWATRVTGNPEYARIAAEHARRLASLLVRPDGSTAQAVNFDRRIGRVLSIDTHQGLAKSSAWSRGQGWAVYGFAQLAAGLRDRALLRVAERAAAYVGAHLPSGGVPRWDYDAPAGAPLDVSAGVITAAGLFHLAAACRELPGVCADPGRWVSLGRRMLASALTRLSGQPPLGFLGPQVSNERAAGCWCNGGELIFGLTYALEALRLERAA